MPFSQDNIKNCFVINGVRITSLQPAVAQVTISMGCLLKPSAPISVFFLVLENFTLCVGQSRQLSAVWYTAVCVRATLLLPADRSVRAMLSSLLTDSIVLGDAELLKTMYGQENSLFKSVVTLHLRSCWQWPFYATCLELRADIWKICPIFEWTNCCLSARLLFLSLLLQFLFSILFFFLSLLLKHRISLC